MKIVECGVLLQFLVSVGKKRVGTTTKRPTVETGTSNPNDVDYDWLPKETLKSLSKCETTVFYKTLGPIHYKLVTQCIKSVTHPVV